MNIIVFGVSHKSSSLNFREKVAFTKTQLLVKAYNFFNQSTFVEEVVILSTCNRSEVFAVVNEIDDAENWFTQFYQDFFQLEQVDLQGSFIFKKEREAVKYLFEICCGLDSLVLGEDQILGQVKDAYQEALDKNASGKILNRLFIEAISTAKEVRTKTCISENPLSISSVAVKQIDKNLGGLKGSKVLVVGYGDMSRIAVENLIEKEVGAIYICNRTANEAKLLEENYNQITYIPYEDKYSVINEVDAIISATSAPHYIFHAQDFKEHYNGTNKICAVDIAVPRDIDPLIEQIENITLFHIDHLKKVIDESLLYRTHCIGEINKIIEESIVKYSEWYCCIPLYPRIDALKNYSKTMVDDELQELFKKLSHVEKKDKELIEVVMRSLVKKILRKPILEMKNAGAHGRGEQVASIVDELFGLSINESSEGGVHEEVLSRDA